MSPLPGEQEVSKYRATYQMLGDAMEDLIVLHALPSLMHVFGFYIYHSVITKLSYEEKEKEIASDHLAQP